MSHAFSLFDSLSLSLSHFLYQSLSFSIPLCLPLSLSLSLFLSLSLSPYLSHSLFLSSSHSIYPSFFPPLYLFNLLAGDYIVSVTSELLRSLTRPTLTSMDSRMKYVSVTWNVFYFFIKFPFSNCMLCSTIKISVNWIGITTKNKNDEEKERRGRKRRKKKSNWNNQLLHFAHTV